MGIKAICAIKIPQFLILCCFPPDSHLWATQQCRQRRGLGRGARRSGTWWQTATNEVANNNKNQESPRGWAEPPTPQPPQNSEFHGSCERRLDNMSDEEFNDYPEVSDQSCVLLL